MPDEIIKKEIIEPERLETEDDQDVIEPGKWYWLKVEETEEVCEGEDEDGEEIWVEKTTREDHLCCAIHIGSNYVLVEDVHGTEWRVHFDELNDELTPEDNPEQYIQSRINHYQGEVREYLAQVNEITQRLGVGNRHALPEKAASEQGYTLATLNAQTDVESYKGSLIRAKEEDLPALFKKIKESNKSMSLWLKASAIPYGVMSHGLEKILDKVGDRIFHVSLYAGLSEEVHQIKEGEPAKISDKLNIIQRLMFMDEEALLDYKAGGMEFRNIKQFDQWLAKPKNLERLMPYPRTLVAFRVRRNSKERYSNDLLSAWINAQLDELDKSTFLYIRNGDNVYRINTDLELGWSIFPDRDEFSHDEKLYGLLDFSEIKSFISETEFNYKVECHKRYLKNSDAHHKKYKKWEKLREEWEQENEGKDNPEDTGHPAHKSNDPGWYYQGNDEIGQDPRNHWHPMDSSSLYYDDMVEKLESDIKYYNRVVLIIQGLFDRSEILHPHPPVRTWEPENFEASVHLVYEDRLLQDGEKPDFEEYRRKLSKSIDTNCVTIGQQSVWHDREVKRAKQRRYDQHGRYSPLIGDPGPGVLARIKKWRPKLQKALFRWERTREWVKDWYNQSYSDKIPCKIEVPIDNLFNVSAYKPGDYLIFFRDYRTRREYLKWAKYLLEAEKFHHYLAKFNGDVNRVLIKMGHLEEPEFDEPDDD